LYYYLDMILVAGGTGVLGSAMVRRLLERRSTDARMTRRRERARPLEERGAEVVVADLRDRARSTRRVAA
jgi:uncharacterized protein YbjT (DUF2867 family)